MYGKAIWRRSIFRAAESPILQAGQRDSQASHNQGVSGKAGCRRLFLRVQQFSKSCDLLSAETCDYESDKVGRSSMRYSFLMGNAHFCLVSVPPMSSRHARFGDVGCPGHSQAERPRLVDCETLRGSGKMRRKEGRTGPKVGAGCTTCQAFYAGCVPVLLSDDVELPFQESEQPSIVHKSQARTFWPGTPSHCSLNVTSFVPETASVHVPSEEMANA